MLQQTQVGRVELKYPAFIKKFPNFAALARAPFSDVLAEWRGMGYNRRALGLKKIAEKVIGEWGGKLPADPTVLVQLPSIGKATASSIYVFAWDKPAAFIETNVRRVFIHHFFDGRESVDDKEIMKIVEQALPPKHCREWYYALMDYGSMLRATVPNPNKKSRHYRAQGKFEGSNRQVRGKILTYLTARPHKRATQAAIITYITTDATTDPTIVEKNIETLAREGFLAIKGKNVYIAS